MIDADTRNGTESRRGAVFLGGATVWSAGGRTVSLTAGLFASKGSAAAGRTLRGARCMTGR
jgi:hypothetical protein